MSGERHSGRRFSINRSVAEIDLLERSTIDELERKWSPARSVEEPDALPEQHRQDVQVDLVEQTAIEELTADRR